MEKQIYELRKFLNDRRELINLSGVEKKAEITNSLLGKFVRGEKNRDLKPEQALRVIKVLHFLGYRFRNKM